MWRITQNEHLYNELVFFSLSQLMAHNMWSQVEAKEWSSFMPVNEGVEGASTRSSSDFCSKCQSFAHWMIIIPMNDLILLFLYAILNLRLIPLIEHGFTTSCKCQHEVCFPLSQFKIGTLRPIIKIDFSNVRWDN